jgi:hypothetical protein
MQSHEYRTVSSEQGGRPMSEQTYWGILCRTCQKLVAFDARPFASFGDKSANIKPGAIRCQAGHTHIYFPKDFCFFPSATPIAEATMEANRLAYAATNWPAQVA